MNRVEVSFLSLLTALSATRPTDARAQPASSPATEPVATDAPVVGADAAESIDGLTAPPRAYGVADPAAFTVRDMDAAAPTEVAANPPADPDDAYSPLALAYMISSVGIAASGISTELCFLAGCDSARGWAGSTLLLTVGGTAVAGRLGKQHRIHPGTATLVAIAPRTATLLTYELIGAARYRTYTDVYDDGYTYASLEISSDGLLGGLLAAQLTSYGAAFLIDRTVRPTPGEVVGADAGALFLTASVVTALYTLPNDPEYDVARVHAGLFVTSAGGLVLGGMMARRAHMRPARVLALEGGALAGSGVGMLTSWFIQGDALDVRGFGLGALVGAAAGAGAVGFASRHWTPSTPRGPLASVHVDVQRTNGGAWLGASGRF